MGVAFAEVSPDFCVCFNTGCYRRAVFVAADGVRDGDAGRLRAGRLGMGATERFYFPISAGMAGAALRAASGADALFSADLPGAD